MRTGTLLLLSVLLCLVILQLSTAQRSSRRSKTSRRQRSDAKTVKDYCRRLNRRKTGKNKIGTEKCHDRLERFCVRRAEKGRSKSRKCKALSSVRPDWDSDIQTRAAPTRRPRRDRGRGRGRKGGRRNRGGDAQTSEEKLKETWGNKRNFRKVWKTVKVKKAKPNQIRSLNQLASRRAFADQQNADAQFGGPPRKVKTKNPKAKPQHSESSVNDPSKYFDSDTDLSTKQYDYVLSEMKALSSGRRKRKVAKAGIYSHWPAGEKISFHFNDNLDSNARDQIRSAIKIWEENTCVRFQENGPNTDRLEFVNGAGCSSYVGRVGGTQEVSIRTPGCNYTGIICHEIGHALGFFHEQARPDRDQSVSINMANVNFWYQNNFAKVPDADVDPRAKSLKYDYGSVMHYDPYSFATNKTVPTIIPRGGKEGYQETMGQRKRPSFIDIAQVNSVYCPTGGRGKRAVNSCSSRHDCQHGGYPHPNDCSKCQCPEGFAGRTCSVVAPSTACPGAGTLEAYNSANKQSLQTPNYPGIFSFNTECVWHIRTTPGYKIYYQLEDDFDLACKSVCDENYLEVKGTADFGITGPRFCCDEIPFDGVQTSQYHELVLILKNLNGDRLNGFRINYWTNDNSRKPGGKPLPTPSPTTRRPPATARPSTGGGSSRGGSSGGGGGGSGSYRTDSRGCRCNTWGRWSGCPESCGGCGRQSRRRGCTEASIRKNCFGKEDRRCNRDPCADKSFRLTPGGLRFRGCCGSEKNGQCGDLDLVQLIMKFTSGSRSGGGDLLGQVGQFFNSFTGGSG